jgi:hypothetical protein
MSRGNPLHSHRASRFIRQWIAPPVFEGDPEKTRRAAWLNTALLTLLTLMPVVVLGALFGRHVPAAVAGVDLCLLAASLVLRAVMRRGRVTQASVWLLALATIGVTVILARLGTVRAPAATMYLQIVITAGLLTGLSGMIATITVCSLAVVGLIVAGNAGILPTPDYSVGITQAVTHTAAFAWTGGLMYAAIRSLQLAVAHAESELAGRVRAEGELAQHLVRLEETVRGRTAELTLVNGQLRDSLANVTTLAGIIPICMHCRKIRDDAGYWGLLEQFIRNHTETEFSHGICPDCLAKHYPGSA